MLCFEVLHFMRVLQTSRVHIPETRWDGDMLPRVRDAPMEMCSDPFGQSAPQEEIVPTKRRAVDHLISNCFLELTERIPAIDIRL